MAVPGRPRSPGKCHGCRPEGRIKFGVGHHLSAHQRVIDVWSRKIVAWEVADREDSQIAADLVSRACLRERISKGRPHPLALHADNGYAMRAATLESGLEELGVLRSFSRPRVSNDNPFSESLYSTVKYRPDDPRRPFQSVEEACIWVAAYVHWYNHQHRRLRGIRAPLRVKTSAACGRQAPPAAPHRGSNRNLISNKAPQAPWNATNARL